MADSARRSFDGQQFRRLPIREQQRSGTSINAFCRKRDMIALKTRAFLLFACLTAAGMADARAGSPLKLHVVETPIRSYRLLSMSMDDKGWIWAGSIHRVIHRYDPRTADVQTIPLPYDCAASSCICAGTKVYVLGQRYPKLIIYDRASDEFREIPYPSSRPDVWYGTEPIAGRHLYLFDRAANGVVKWDVRSDTPTLIKFPYPAPSPSAGHYERRDGAVWCRLWEYPPAGRYQPVGLARLDVVQDRFAGWWQFPGTDDALEPYSDPATTFFVPYTLEGKIIPFDHQARRWCRFLNVPHYGERFAFMGGPVKHGSRYYFTLSTYDGDDVGCDGQPYHFLNAILEFDPRSRRFELLTLDVPGRYYQVAYLLSAAGQLYATGSNIREPDGSLNRGRRGEVVVWQSHAIGRAD